MKDELCRAQFSPKMWRFYSTADIKSLPRLFSNHLGLNESVCCWSAGLYECFDMSSSGWAAKVKDMGSKVGFSLRGEGLWPNKLLARKLYICNVAFRSLNMFFLCKMCLKLHKSFAC